MFIRFSISQWICGSFLGLSLTAFSQPCSLYPIGVQSSTLDNVQIGQELSDILNGGGPGNEGWLTWEGVPSTPVLVSNLSAPFDADTYINPDDANDTVLSVGDYIQGKPGLSNSKRVHEALNRLLGEDLVLPVWSETRGRGAKLEYRVAAFAAFRLTGYNLSRQKRISATFHGWVSCSGENQAPVVDAGADQVMTHLTAASLSGTVTDDGLPAGARLAVSWSQVNGPGYVLFSKVDDPVTQAEFSEVGDYELALNVSDSRLLGRDTVHVSVRPPGPNAGPVVDAGADQTIGYVSNAFLQGVVRDDGLPWAAPLSNQWTLISGPGSAVFADASAVDTEVTFDVSGTYTLEFSSSDTEYTSQDTVVFNVHLDNLPPKVDAGADQTLSATRVSLAGSVSDDALPGPVALQWSQVTGPDTATFLNDTSAITDVRFSQSGTYVLRLTAHDGEYAVSDDLTIVLDGNQPPQVHAGIDQVIDLTLPPMLVNGGTNVITVASPLPDDWQFEMAQPGVEGIAFNAGTPRIEHESIAVVSDREVYITGAFNEANGVEVNGIAKWDGCTYTALFQPGLTDPGAPTDQIGFVRRLKASLFPVAATESHVFVGGAVLKDLNHDGGGEFLAQWDGMTWTNWFDRQRTFNFVAHHDMAVSSNAVYVVGDFRWQNTPDIFGHDPVPGFSEINNIAKWNLITEEWEAMGTGVTDDRTTFPQTLRAVAVGPNGWVYVGGKFHFQTPSGAVATNVAYWNGAEWKAMGEGVYTAGGGFAQVQALHVDERGTVSVGGQFNTAGTQVANNMAQAVFDPNTQTWTWSTLGSGNGLPAPVNAIETRGGHLWAVGEFNLASGRIAVWNGQNWSPPPSIVYPGNTTGWEMRSLANSPSGMYVGGLMQELVGVPVGRIAKFGVPIPPEMTCPNDVVTHGPAVGVPVELSPDVFHACGKDLTVTFTVDGGVFVDEIQVTNGASAVSAPVRFIHTYLPGTHAVTITVEDGISPPLSCSVEVIVLAPSSALLNGLVTDDGLPAGMTQAQWSVVSGPAALDFDPTHSAVTTATFTDAGTYVLQLLGSDTLLSAEDRVTIHVQASGAVNLPPAVQAGQNRSILPGDTINLLGSVTDDGLPAAVSSQWSVVSGPVSSTFGDVANPVTTATFVDPGIYVLRLTGDDSDFVSFDQLTVVVRSEVNLPPVVSAGGDFSGRISNEAVLTTDVSDDGQPLGILNTQWSKLSGPGNVLFKNNNGEYTALFGAAGTYELQLVGNDLRLSATDTVTVTVFDIPANAPVVEITSPVDGGTLSAPSDIIGTVESDVPASYEVQIRAVQLTAGGSPQGAHWTPMASGNSPVTASVLGQIDPTLLLNGQYEIRIVAVDQTGETLESEVVRIVVDGNMKVGNFSISFSDLSVPLNGIPIEVIRTYDSRDKRAGDFGAGWSLSLKDMRLQKNRALGERWFQEITGFVGGLPIPIYEMSPHRDRIVTITMPDNEVFQFRAAFDPASQTAVPILSGTVRFVPVDGTRGSLEVENAPTGIRVTGNLPTYDPFLGITTPFGFVDLLDLDTLVTFEPTLFRFTSQDGNVFIIDEVDGLQKVIDRNGNEVTYTENGIFHSNGESVTFVRDAQDRIERIIDPAGQELTYTYDAAGDLTVFTDRTTNRTTFVYTNDHFLVEIMDPRGVQAVRTEYDAEGRMIRQVDAEGREIEFTHDIVNRTETIEDRLGNVTVHSYDDRGNVLQTIDALGNVTGNTYDEFDNQLSTTDPLGNTTRWTYDAVDNKNSETDPLGHTTFTDYNAFRQPTRITDPNGNTTDFDYSFTGNLTNLVDAAGHGSAFTYDGVGNLLREIDALGNVISNQYDGAGRLIQRMDALGTIRTFGYDDHGNLTVETTVRTLYDIAGAVLGSESITVSKVYDRENRLLKTINPDGSFTQTDYNEAGQVIRRIDELGRITRMKYNDRGELIQTLAPDGGVMGMAYDDEGRKVAETNQVGDVTTFHYDPLGRLTNTVYADGASEIAGYDAAGRMVESIDARGHVTSFGYDAAGRRTGITNTLEQVTVFEYDNNGNLLRFIDAKGHVVRNVYDSLNRRTQVVFHDGTTQATVYDALGRRIREVDPSGLATDFGYDSLGRLLQVTKNQAPGITNHTQFAYDELGNQIAQIDANTNITAYTYDHRGRRITRRLPEGQVETMAYDVVGNVTNKIDFNGRSTAYAYDSMNRLITKMPDAVFAAPNVEYGYDLRGLRTHRVDNSGTTSYQYDSRGRRLQKSTPTGDLNYTYDLTGNLQSTLSSNVSGLTLTYTHDALNRLRTVVNPNTGLTLYRYDAVGNLQDAIMPNGHNQVYEYDALNRLTNLTANALTTPIAQYQYTLRPTGHRQSVAEMGGRTVRYQYDKLYRLTQEKVTQASLPVGTADYTHDAVGNRLVRTSTLPNLASQSFDYDANDLLTTDTYDHNGNTIVAQASLPVGGTGTVIDEYDFENRLIKRSTSSGDIIEILYDDDGYRVRKTVNGLPTSYLVDDNNHTGYAQVVEELGTEVSGLVVHTVYTYGHDLISQERVDFSSSTWIAHHYGTDGHGNIRFLTDATGAITDTYDYDAFGNLIASTGTTVNDYLYTGEQYDSDLGMYFLRARYMDTVRGRFWNMDTFEGAQYDPISLNKYLYANANAVNYIDPTGESSIIEVFATGLIVGTLSNLSKPNYRNSLINFYTVAILVHWNRNEFNEPPATEAEAVGKGWTRLKISKGIFHMQGPGGFNNSKYVSPNGYNEAVYDRFGNLDESSLNGGTWNYAHPLEEPVAHVLKDVLPYYILGNSYDDPSTFRDKIELSLTAYYLGKEGL